MKEQDTKCISYSIEIQTAKEKANKTESLCSVFILLLAEAHHKEGKRCIFFWTPFHGLIIEKVREGWVLS